VIAHCGHKFAFGSQTGALQNEESLTRSGKRTFDRRHGGIRCVAHPNDAPPTRHGAGGELVGDLPYLITFQVHHSEWIIGATRYPDDHSPATFPDQPDILAM
jgi:hypothetical protein